MRARQSARVATPCCSFAFALLLNGCYSYSNLQSARLHEKDHGEIIPSYTGTYVSWSDDTEPREKLTDHLGFQFVHGASDRVNSRFRIEIMTAGDDERSYGVYIGGGPKVGLVKDVFALSVPFGFQFGEELTYHGFQIHPTLHETIPVSRQLEVNFSQALLIFPTIPDALVALTWGVGFGPNLERWAIRPEVGYLFDANPPERGDRFDSVAISIGFSYKY